VLLQAQQQLQAYVNILPPPLAAAHECWTTTSHSSVAATAVGAAGRLYALADSCVESDTVRLGGWRVTAGEGYACNSCTTPVLRHTHGRRWGGAKRGGLSNLLCAERG